MYSDIDVIYFYEMSLSDLLSKLLNKKEVRVERDLLQEMDMPSNAFIA